MSKSPLYVRYIGGHKGRGVFTGIALRKGQLIEVCPVILVLNHTRVFSDYEIAWGRKVALIGGHAHLYNHSARPNVAFVRDLVRGEVRVKARRIIDALEELTICYACKPWFKVEEKP